MRRPFLLFAAVLACACARRPDARPDSAASRPAVPAAGSVAVANTARPAPAPAGADSEAADMDDDDVAPPAAARPPRIRHLPAPDPMRGLYVNRAAAAGPAMWNLIALARRTAVNTLVIDVKDDRGRVLYPSTVGLAHAIGADADGALPVARVHALMDSLRAHRIFAVARIVVGVDPLLAARHPDWAVKRRDDGLPWRDRTGALWIDPSHRAVWAYAADLASEAAARGFGAVEFDDVRFPDAPGMAGAVRFALPPGRDRARAIRDGLAFLDYRAGALGVPIAFTVAGAAAADSGAARGGERWDALAGRADLVMPREFPSAFPAGAFGLADPAAQPYELVSRALADAKRRNSAVRGAGTLVPWYQDFSMGAAAYDSARVRDEIRAGYAAGIRSWLMWNPASRYTEAALHEPAPRRDTTAARAKPAAKGKKGHPAPARRR